MPFGEREIKNGDTFAHICDFLLPGARRTASTTELLSTLLSSVAPSAEPVRPLGLQPSALCRSTQPMCVRVPRVRRHSVLDLPLSTVTALSAEPPVD